MLMMMRWGLAKLLDVTWKVALEGKLNVQFDHNSQTWNAIGDNGPWYDSVIGVHTRDALEPFHNIWKQVDADSKKLILNRMTTIISEYYWFNFDLDANGGLIRSIIDRDCTKCYKDWKNDLHNYFKDLGGADNEDSGVHHASAGPRYVREHMMGVGPTLPRRTIPSISSSLGFQSEYSSSLQLPSENQSWINFLEVNLKNILAPGIPSKDLVPPRPSTNPSSLQVDDDAADDDDETANLGD
ncbi:hypothetical protein TIFTF001_039164 [Ficus carica]|uniref:Uncharacterized protein n=1 Tax=Ficus carica TaxID=3494 RepID=A0AA88E8Q4_FICCA|nr:hypothetical protein TIFTF001_039160 [Ficus carica]GMN70122.1 hypothetical protein TIFTF001_039164 [Ficus carica]